MIQSEVDELIKQINSLDAEVLKDKYDQILYKIKGIQGRRTDQLTRDLRTLKAAVSKSMGDQVDQMDTSTGDILPIPDGASDVPLVHE